MSTTAVFHLTSSIQVPSRPTMNTVPCRKCGVSAGFYCFGPYSEIRYPGLGMGHADRAVDSAAAQKEWDRIMSALPIDLPEMNTWKREPAESVF